MKTLAPIVLFTYNRLWHTQKTIESLSNNELASQSDLIVYSDSYKTEAEKENVLEVRSYLKEINGFKSVTIIEHEKNKGLAESVISGVSETLKNHDRIIVIEDDLILSPWFLTFMNDALEIYKDEDRIGNVNGHTCKLKKISVETFLIYHADSWGWGTWARAWNLFERDGSKLLQELKAKNLCHKFDIDGGYKFTRMLEKQISGENNSWAIRWKASLLIHDKLSINAGKSLVKNIGSDGSGTHSGYLDLFPTTLFCGKITLTKKPINEESADARAALKKMYKWNNSKFHKLIIWSLYCMRRLLHCKSAN